MPGRNAHALANESGRLLKLRRRVQLGRAVSLQGFAEPDDVFEVERPEKKGIRSELIGVAEEHPAHPPDVPGICRAEG